MKLTPAKNKEKWMACPVDFVEFPGLAYIYHLNELIISKKLDALHECFGKIELGYTIYNKNGEKVFLAVRYHLDQTFLMKIFNHYGNEVINIKISKPSAWFCNKALVWAPPDNYVGAVEQRPTIKDKFTFADKFLVKNSQNEVVLDIIANGVNNFVYSLNSCGEEVGVIMEKWGGGKNFGVSFPEDLRVGDKAVVLGACFLIGCLKY
ncbi:phospholipid scramblase 1-like [Choristoneura fumiferana]|uniref:phospholipid scramblase 1-like n=1 Tax=Choristoneura fumiferana TaxID=7141 RepID=UPI003D155396